MCSVYSRVLQRNRVKKKESPEDNQNILCLCVGVSLRQVQNAVLVLYVTF